ncbi:MAG: DUF975 family protein [Lachnospiraceae bacterium]|nr:DUF975 family protein [Lachnospiraceae bacterium]
MKGKSVSVLKSITREQLLGNYSKLTGYVLLYLLLQFTVAQILVMINIDNVFIRLLVNFIQSVFTNIFVIGLYRVCMLTVRSQQVSLKEYFYAFTHDPDKVVIISAVMMLFVSLIYIPVILPRDAVLQLGMGEGTLLLIKCVWMCAGLIIYVFFMIHIALWIMLYIERPELSSGEILLLSKRVMKNHKLRYFYLLFNQLGVVLLIILTATIGSLWLMPYICVLNINFYEDVKGETDGYLIEA